ncbi:hypothetical protein TWF696_005809 [Orbilia brochopaga]|uniref:Uncharacterized protein n=1 Tax=Orbilia brochopaga TaxID=3140254 RepID=A0AAV9UV68_9PEZI
MAPQSATLDYEEECVERVFNQTKTSTETIRPNHICNADLSKDALEKIFKTTVPDFESSKLYMAGLMHLCCSLDYNVRVRNPPSSSFEMSLYQCETVEEARNIFKGSLYGYNMPGLLRPGPAKTACIGSYALGGLGRLKFVRDTMFVDIMDPSFCLKEEEMLKLGKALDNHFVAGRVETPRQKTLPSCILHCSEKMTVPVGQTITLKVKHDENHYRLDATIEHPDLIGATGWDKDPSEMSFEASKEGVTRICLISIHNKTFHTARSRPVEVNITSRIC